MRPTRLALLIDGENFPARLADTLMQRVLTLGEARVRRIYGGASPLGLSEWALAAARHGMMICPTPRATPQKNSADIALAIAAMDILHGGQADGFCIASSDGDFSGLAQRLAQSGLPVIGFGEDKAPVAFRLSCQRFEALTLASVTPIARAAPKRPALALVPPRPTPASPGDILRQAIGRICAEHGDTQGWVHAGVIGERLRKSGPAFSYENNGVKTLTALLKLVDDIEMMRTDKNVTLVRLRGADRRP